MGEQAGAVMGPREVFARMQQQWLGNAVDAMDSLLAEDAIIETPFAPPGRPRRFQGRAEFLAFARAGRGSLPVRFEDCREVAIHETADPGVIVVEYELAGTVTTTGQRAAAPFIGVLQVRDGQITRWREYQDAVAIAHALGQLPALLASVSASQPGLAVPGHGG
jgi:ketosteroid isomerase-like protein